MTHVHVEASGRRVEPFGDPPGELLIGNRRLADWQEEMIREAGFTRVERLEPPCLVVPDTLFTTGPLLRRFVEQAGGRNAVLVLADSLFARTTTPVQPGVLPTEGGWRFEALRFVSGGPEQAVEVSVDPEEQRFELPLPVALEPTGSTEISLPRHPVMTLHHWVHILWANHAARGMEVRRLSRWKGALRLTGALLRCWSFNKWRLLSKLNTIGKGCDIHPSAIIEASVLGDGVSVGPQARILFSRIGDGASIFAGGQVEASTVGERATVAQYTGLRMCVLYPESFAAQQGMQACVLGRRVVTTTGSFSIDMNFERDIHVPLDGELHSTGSSFLGSAFGHECRVGTGIWLASGRAIPNGAFVIRDPRQVITKLPAQAGREPLTNVGGTLQPLETPAQRQGPVRGGRPPDSTS